ncbi:Inosine-uridine nucleoside N-ribohydrolase [Xenococcus sp. PCC 7305]|nr:Inosine-uridine nucleoside N-ribohydrolase [Xenococcus sp. PCC 7305]
MVTTSSTSNAVKLIYDTDISNDADDVSALAMIHALVDNGEAELLAVVTNSNARSDRTASTVDVINTYYNRPNIPIGVTKVTDLQEDGSWYGHNLYKMFPQDTPNDEQVADAVDVLRATLAAAEDNSISYIQAGYPINMASLLRSEPDEHSSLNGIDLVRQKVKVVVMMGGQYPHPGTEWNFSRNRPQDTKYVVDTWPTRMVFAGSEIGWRMYSGTSLQNVPVSNPVRYTYEVFKGFDTPNNAITDGFHSWDPPAVLWAVRGDQDLWTRINEGFNQVNDDGSSQWQTWRDDDRHEYLVKTQDDSVYIDIFDELYIRPPINIDDSLAIQTESNLVVDPFTGAGSKELSLDNNFTVTYSLGLSSQEISNSLDFSWGVTSSEVSELILNSFSNIEPTIFGSNMQVIPEIDLIDDI